MAKKILKRSLALGALMAFVITGSAMAKEFGGKDYSYSSKKPTDIRESYKLNVEGGSVDEVIGANYFGINEDTTWIQNNDEKISINKVFTTISGDVEVEEGLYGGTKIAGGYPDGGNYPRAGLQIDTNETNLIINGGTFGTTNSDDGFRKIVVAGDFIKERGTNYGNEVKILSNIDKSNITINSGTFDSVVFGGSVIGVYGYHLVNDVAKVKEANIVVNGGTFNAPLVAGGGSYNIVGNYPNNEIREGSQILSEVENTNLLLNGGTFNGEIYAGGLQGVKENEIPNTMPVSKVGVTNISIKGEIKDSIYGYNIKANRVDSKTWKFATDYSKSVTTNIVVESQGSVKNIDIVKGSVIFKDGATWDIGTSTSNIATNVTLKAGSSLAIDGDSFERKEKDNVYAVNGIGYFKAEEGAKLVITGLKETTYNIAKGFENYSVDGFVVADNALMAANINIEDDELTAIIAPKSMNQIVDSTGVSSNAGSMLESVVGMASTDNVPDASKPAIEFIVNAMAGQASGNTPEGAGTAINSALQIGEAGGNSGTALSVVNNVAGVTTQRLSFSQMNTAPQGGHGKVERKYKSGAGVWAQYMHGKDKVEDMPMDSLKSSYESQYNGAVIGYDFKEVGKTKTGIAFNYGEGDSHSTGGSIATRSDFDFWGIGLYHNIMNDDTNLILDVNYSKSDSDVTQINGGTTLTANPETTTLSAGVKFEKLIQNGPVQIVPYAGLRFMSVDTDDYAANIAGKKAFMYAPDRQNIWLIPVGVSLRQENTYENGWRVTPKADLSYIWAVGDTDSSMTVSIPGITNVANMNYTVMDNGSFLGTLGIEAEKGDWTYGLSYSYQKGEYQRSDKWFVDVRYSF